MGILPLLISGFLTVQAHAAGQKSDVQPQTIMMSTLTSGWGVSCTVSVEKVVLPDTGPDEKVKIQCDNKTTMIYDFPLAGIYGLAVASDDSGRIEVDWERGTGYALTILQVQTISGKTSAKKVFEHISPCGGESFEGINIVLANIGRRDLGHEILPAATNMYRWQDGKYAFVAGYKWNPDAKQSDRYCILLPSGPCPAVKENRPISGDD